jgi:hypothetical protein
MRFIRLPLMLLALAVTVSAQKYSTPVFSATFNCPVMVDGPDPQYDSDGSPLGTSTGYWCGSIGPGLSMETIRVTRFDRDIAVDFLYADPDHKQMNEERWVDTSKGYYQGHPFTYVKAEFTGNDQLRWRRSKLIVVNARTTIWILMDAPVHLSDDKTWEDFANSLVIS